MNNTEKQISSFFRHQGSDIKPHFTLIELLVVIGILGALMAITLPALQQAKKTGKRANCISNLKQVGLSIQIYAEGNNNYFPWNCTSQILANPGRRPLASAVGLNNRKELFKCPDENENLYSTEGSSYIWNWTQIELPGNEKSDRKSYDTIPFGGMVHPESFAIMIDAGPYHGKSGKKSAFNVLYASGRVDDASDFPF